MGIIEDGTGKGFEVKVNEMNEMHVRSRQIARISEVTSMNAESYYLHSGFVDNVANTAFSGIFYIKNTGSKSMFLYTMRTCGTAVQQWQIKRNPTTGTLISAGTTKASNNLNFGSNSTATASLLAGANGSTVTDGDLAAHWINNIGHSTEPLEGAIKLTPGNSLSFECKPAATATVCVTILAWFE